MLVPGDMVSVESRGASAVRSASDLACSTMLAGLGDVLIFLAQDEAFEGKFLLPLRLVSQVDAWVLGCPRAWVSRHLCAHVLMYSGVQASGVPCT